MSGRGVCILWLLAYLGKGQLCLAPQAEVYLVLDGAR